MAQEPTIAQRDQLLTLTKHARVELSTIGAVIGGA